MKKLKVGVIGLGEVAQIIHLPILESLSECYEIAAICDISPSLVQWAGTRYGVHQQYTDALELVKQSDLDAVFILNSNEYHTTCAIAAIGQKKHVFIEKPMTMTQQEADAIIEARDEHGVKVMVGYMRRYAPAFTQAVQDVKDMGRIQYAVIRGIIGMNHFFTNQTSTVHRFTDIPAEAVIERKTIHQRLMKQAIGEVSQEIYNAYSLLLGLGSHDISAMRELIGVPNRVVSAVQWQGGSCMAATFEYDGFYATYETGLDQNRRFDAHIEVFGSTKQLKIQYNTPYIRHLPTTLHVGETIGEAYEERVHRPTFKDPYTIEMEIFHESITQDNSLKTTPEDYKQDLTIFKMMVDQMLITYKPQ
jgi:predicted dehydrogenase